MYDPCVDALDRYLTNNLSKARLLAQNAHAGQVDKAGKPYFLHVEKVSRTVGDMISSWDPSSFDFYLQARIVGYLHDVVEDTELTAADLREQEIPTDCILAIEAMTKVEGTAYQTYLDIVKKNKLAAVVKIADMMHNSDLSRLEHITEEDLARKEKYQKAIAYLSEFTCARCGQTLPLSAMGQKSTRSGEIFCQNCLDQYEIGYDGYQESQQRRTNG